MQTEMSSFAYWRFMLAFWLTCGYFNVFSNYVNKKMTKKALFLAALFPIEIRTLSLMISLKCAEFLVLTGIEGLGIMSGYEKLVRTSAEYGQKLHEVTEKICVAKIDSFV